MRLIHVLPPEMSPNKKLHILYVVVVVVTSVFQGDMEKSLGWKPIPLFDKDYAGEMPAMQVKMLSVCIILSQYII